MFQLLISCKCQEIQTVKKLQSKQNRTIIADNWLSYLLWGGNKDLHSVQIFSVWLFAAIVAEIFWKPQ